ncbi:MAG: hypothetical protein Q8J69_11780 [Sphingobacteriaceae bacterium]|nr:hypothetical protein [Sphingobacteriaceae bacterium]
MRTKLFLLMALMGASLVGVAQTETKARFPRYAIIGVNLGPLMLNQFQLDAEFGQENKYVSLMVSAFYGQNGAYSNYNGEVFSSSYNQGLGIGLRIYETAFGNTRFFFQPSLYYKQLAVSYKTMRFIPTTYDGLPAMRWGEAVQTDEYRGFVGEALAGSQTSLGPIIVEGGFGFVYRNLNAMQPEPKRISSGAAWTVGLNEFSPLLNLKLGYKF